MQTDRAINLTKTEDGKNLIDPVEINAAFTNYYKELYKSEYTDNPEKNNNFLNQLRFPTLTEKAEINLEKQLCIEELIEALKGMSSGKAPGPDGLPTEICKKFSAKLLPHLLNVFNESY